MSLLEIVKLLRDIKSNVNSDVNKSILWDMCMDSLYPDYRDYVEAVRNNEQPDYLIDALFEEILDIMEVKD